MREIKLRAWSKSAKVMHPSWMKLDDENGEYVLMQYTGLLDKNGKEIYEGDIVKYTKHEGYLLPDSVGEVIWKDVGYSISDPKGRTHDIDFWEADELETDVLDHCEIIGNIYENPELLTPLKERNRYGKRTSNRIE